MAADEPSFDAIDYAAALLARCMTARQIIRALVAKCECSEDEAKSHLKSARKELSRWFDQAPRRKLLESTAFYRETIANVYVSDSVRLQARQRLDELLDIDRAVDDERGRVEPQELELAMDAIRSEAEARVRHDLGLAGGGPVSSDASSQQAAGPVAASGADVDSVADAPFVFPSDRQVRDGFGHRDGNGHHDAERQGPDPLSDASTVRRGVP